MTDGGNIDCDGLSETGRVRAVNDDQFMIADLHKSMVLHRTSIALGEHSPVFGDTLGPLLLVAANAGETADARVSTMTVKTITHSCSTSCHGSIGLMGSRKTISWTEQEQSLA